MMKPIRNWIGDIGSFFFSNNNEKKISNFRRTINDAIQEAIFMRSNRSKWVFSMPIHIFKSVWPFVQHFFLSNSNSFDSLVWWHVPIQIDYPFDFIQFSILYSVCSYTHTHTQHQCDTYLYIKWEKCSLFSTLLIVKLLRAAHIHILAVVIIIVASNVFFFFASLPFNILTKIIM